ncbi:MAG: VOC family protein [Alphaproteobacteria bacterium]|nr:VOC family protein [Alphaproteobacteria bacterium]
MGAFRIVELDHVVLRVVDVDRAKRFYCDMLGCREERRLDDFGIVQLRAGKALIDLVPLGGFLGRRGGRAAAADGRNMEHFCLRIDPFDERVIRALLAAHGVTPDRVEERYGADGYGPSMYIRDPDGNVVELKGPPQRPALNAV